MPDSRLSIVPITDARYPLLEAYLHRFGAVAPLYDYSPHDPASYGERARELAGHHYDRERLASVLVDYNASLGAPPEVLASAGSLAESRTVVVISGQQPGVLTGPLYTFWKALAVVQLARAVAEHLPAGTRVVPVFWIGAEDHDLVEVASVTVRGPDGSLRRLTYQPGVPHGPRTSVGLQPAGAAALRLIEEFEEALGPAQFGREVSEVLRETAGESSNLGDWFGRLLLGLLGREGLVLANPLLPGLRALQGPAFSRMIEDNEGLARAFFEGRERVVSLGLEPQVDKEPDSANLYLYRGRERVPLYRREGGAFMAGRENPAPLSTSELLEIARSRPERLSPNVVLRPLSQDAVFPVLAYVGGPGETSYFGLYRAVYHRFGRRLPVIYPRPGVTIVEPKVRRSLEKCGLDAAEALNLERLREREGACLREADPVGIDLLFEQAAARVRDIYAGPEGLLSPVTRVDPSLQPLVDRSLRSVLKELARFRRQVWQRHRRACRDTLDRFRALETALRPRGDYQERVLNIFPFLARYGPGLVRDLAGVDLVPRGAAVEPGHRLVWL